MQDPAPLFKNTIMKTVKMLKTFGTRIKGLTYTVTSRTAEIFIQAGIAAEPDAPKVKENKEAKGRKTK